MKYLTADRLIRIVFAGMAFALILSWGTNIANAQESGSALTIAPTGQVIVKDAKVVAVNGSIIVAQTVWGSAIITLTIQTSGSTRFVPSIGSVEFLRSIKPGNSISFSGALAGTLSDPTVSASVVKDSTLLQESASIVGSVVTVDVKGGTLEVASDGGRTTVRVPVGTLMSRDGGYTNLSGIRIGDTIKATGTLDTSADVLTAQRVTVSTPATPEESATEEEQPVGEDEGSNVISSILSWFRSSRGMLSVR